MKVAVFSVLLRALSFIIAIGESVGQEYEARQGVKDIGGLVETPGSSVLADTDPFNTFSDSVQVSSEDNRSKNAGGLGGRRRHNNNNGGGGGGGGGGRRQHQDCNNGDIAECVELLEVLTNKDLGFAATVDELNNMCPVLLEGLQCIDNYTRRCLTQKHREYFNKLYAGTIRVIKDLCNTRGHYQEEYIRHAPCMRQVNPKYNVCSVTYHTKTAGLNHINEAEVQLSEDEKNRNVIILCCSFQEYLQCSERVVYETCGNETALFTKEFLDRMAGPIVQDLCPGFTYSLHTCPQVPSPATLESPHLPTTFPHPGTPQTMGLGDFTLPSDREGLPSPSEMSGSGSHIPIPSPDAPLPSRADLTTPTPLAEEIYTHGTTLPPVTSHSEFPPGHQGNIESINSQGEVENDNTQSRSVEDRSTSSSRGSTASSTVRISGLQSIIVAKTNTDHVAARSMHGEHETASTAFLDTRDDQSMSNSDTLSPGHEHDGRCQGKYPKASSHTRARNASFLLRKQINRSGLTGSFNQSSTFSNSSLALSYGGHSNEPASRDLIQQRNLPPRAGMDDYKRQRSSRRRTGHRRSFHTCNRTSTMDSTGPSRRMHPVGARGTMPPTARHHPRLRHSRRHFRQLHNREGSAGHRRGPTIRNHNVLVRTFNETDSGTIRHGERHSSHRKITRRRRPYRRRPIVQSRGLAGMSPETSRVKHFSQQSHENSTQPHVIYETTRGSQTTQTERSAEMMSLISTTPELPTTTEEISTETHHETDAYNGTVSSTSSRPKGRAKPPYLHNGSRRPGARRRFMRRRRPFGKTRRRENSSRRTNHRNRLRVQGSRSKVRTKSVTGRTPKIPRTTTSTLVLTTVTSTPDTPQNAESPNDNSQTKDTMTNVEIDKSPSYSETIEETQLEATDMVSEVTPSTTLHKLWKNESTGIEVLTEEKQHSKTIPKISSTNYLPEDKHDKLTITSTETLTGDLTSEEVLETQQIILEDNEFVKNAEDTSVIAEGGFIRSSSEGKYQEERDTSAGAREGKPASPAELLNWWLRSRLQEEVMEAVIPAPTPVPYSVRQWKELDDRFSSVTFVPLVLDILESDFIPIIDPNDSDIQAKLESGISIKETIPESGEVNRASTENTKARGTAIPDLVTAGSSYGQEQGSDKLTNLDGGTGSTTTAMATSFEDNVVAIVDRTQVSRSGVPLSTEFVNSEQTVVEEDSGMGDHIPDTNIKKLHIDAHFGVTHDNNISNSSHARHNHSSWDDMKPNMTPSPTLNEVQRANSTHSTHSNQTDSLTPPVMIETTPAEMNQTKEIRNNSRKPTTYLHKLLKNYTTRDDLSSNNKTLIGGGVGEQYKDDETEDWNSNSTVTVTDTPQTELEVDSSGGSPSGGLSNIVLVILLTVLCL